MTYYYVNRALTNQVPGGVYGDGTIGFTCSSTSLTTQRTGMVSRCTRRCRPPAGYSAGNSLRRIRSRIATVSSGRLASTPMWFIASAYGSDSLGSLKYNALSICSR
jgi:hypothetical protein